MTRDMNPSEKDYTLVNVLLLVALIATVASVILSCVLPYMVFPWLALSFGVVTLVLGIIRYFEW